MRTSTIVGYMLAGVGMSLMLWVGAAAVFFMRPAGTGLAGEVQSLLQAVMTLESLWVALIGAYLYLLGIAIARSSSSARLACAVLVVLFAIYSAATSWLEPSWDLSSLGVDLALLLIFIGGLAFLWSPSHRLPSRLRCRLLPPSRSRHPEWRSWRHRLPRSPSRQLPSGLAGQRLRPQSRRPRRPLSSQGFARPR